MPSTVTNYSNNINVLYPIPGVDNDTQGFRDNFSNIKNALSAASVELDNLLLNTSKLNIEENDYNYSARIYRAPLKATGSVITTSNTDPSSDKEVNFLSGGYHTVTLQGTRTLNLTNFRDGLYCSMMIEVLNHSGSTTVNFNTNGNIKTNSSNLTLPKTLSTNTATSHLFEVWSTDGGDNVFVNFLGEYNV